MADEKKPNWAVIIPAIAAVVVALSGAAKSVYDNWPRKPLLSTAEANAKAQREIELAVSLAMQQPEAEQVIFDDARGRYVVRVYRDESLIQYRKYPDGHERSRFVQTLERELHADVNADAMHAALGLPEPAVVCEWVRHTDPPQVTPVSRDRCRVDVYLSWPDGCRAVQFYDPCRSIFGPVQFTECPRHGGREVAAVR